MGHNVDLSNFGMCAIRCQQCGAELDLSEVDIDCDLKTHNPMVFELNLQCTECEEENHFKFKIVEVR
jgi:hypothetical protein